MFILLFTSKIEANEDCSQGSNTLTIHLSEIETLANSVTTLEENSVANHCQEHEREFRDFVLAKIGESAELWNLMRACSDNNRRPELSCDQASQRREQYINSLIGYRIISERIYRSLVEQWYNDLGPAQKNLANNCYFEDEEPSTVQFDNHLRVLKVKDGVQPNLCAGVNTLWMASLSGGLVNARTNPELVGLTDREMSFYSNFENSLPAHLMSDETKMNPNLSMDELIARVDADIDSTIAGINRLQEGVRELSESRLDHLYEFQNLYQNEFLPSLDGEQRSSLYPLCYNRSGWNTCLRVTSNRVQGHQDITRCLSQFGDLGLELIPFYAMYDAMRDSRNTQMAHLSEVITDDERAQLQNQHDAQFILSVPILEVWGLGVSRLATTSLRNTSRDIALTISRRNLINSTGNSFNYSEAARRLRNLSGQARAQWNIENARFIEESRRSIEEALPMYLEAKRNGHPHIEWLESMGFIIEEGNVQVPELTEVIARMYDQYDELIVSGRVSPRDLMRPVRVYRSPEGEVVTFEIGEVIPEGYTPHYEVLHVAATSRMMRDGLFPMAEAIGMGPPGYENTLTFSLHDLAHFGGWMDNPEFFRLNREMGSRFAEANVVFPRFHRPHETWEVDELDSLNEFLPESITRYRNQEQYLERVNNYFQSLPVEERLEIISAHRQSTNPLNERQVLGLRMATFLETASYVPENRATAMWNRWTSSRVVPPLTNGRRFTVEDIRAHINEQNLSTRQLLEFAQNAPEEFSREVFHFGGAANDIVAFPAQFEYGITHASHYLTPDYLSYRLRELGRQSEDTVDREELIEAISRMTVGTIESRHITPEILLDASTNPQIDPSSPVFHWFCRSGAFYRTASRDAFCY